MPFVSIAAIPSAMLSPIALKSVALNAVASEVHIPIAHTDMVFPNSLKSNVLKRLLIPLAIDSPNFFQSVW